MKKLNHKETLIVLETSVGVKHLVSFYNFYRLRKMVAEYFNKH